jgi:NitT/TauT family transport system substrate-binding protein
MKIAIPDLISNSYFPVIAAVELGAFRDEGLDMELELIFPVDHTLEVLRDGAIHFVGGSAHSVPFAFPGWQGGKLLAAQAQNMYWFLVLRKELNARKGDLNAIKGLRIGAAPLVRLGLQGMLEAAGIDMERDGVQIVPVPGAFLGENKNFGVAAAKALKAGLIDGFWANGMGAEVAVRSGAGTVVIDARRGDGPAGAVHYTASALITSEALIQDNPQAAAAAVRALVRTQRKLQADPGLATQAAARYYPPEETALIAELIRRDGPYLTPHLSHEFVDGIGLLTPDQQPRYEDVVATQFSALWDLP